jgi:putative tricarboxylic transport membrane protein
LILTLLAALLSSEPAYERLRIVAPAAPGGGWDQTARFLAEVFRKEGLAEVVEVENVSGAAGTIGLARFASSYRGEGSALLVTGLVMMSAIVMNDAPVSLAETTPVARLTGEYEVLVVPEASPFRTLEELTDALRRDPEAISFAGGSAGGTDQLVVGLLARQAGVDPRRTTYVAFSGGGESLAALLGGQVDAGVSGLSEYSPHIDSGRLRALAISSPEPVPGRSIPTFREQGFDLALANWRGVVGPPGMREEARASMVAALDRLVSAPAWREVLDRNGWSDLYLTGEELEGFLAAEQSRVSSIVHDLGAAPEVSSAYPVAVGLGILGLGSLLAAGRGIEKPARGNRRAMGLVASGAVANLFLLEPLGFVVASSVLFSCTARAFGSRRWARDALLGLALSTALYFLFTRGLSLDLPAGRLFW